MERSAYLFQQEPRGPAYYEVLDSSLTRCETALLVVRDDADKQRAIEALAPHLSYEGRASYWPAQRSAARHVQTVLHYDITPALVDVLKSMTDRLYAWDWLSELPEDLSLLRPDGSHYLASSAHEREAWMWLTEDEKLQLDVEAPALSPLLALDSAS
jgi:hypothetical protein